jgi:tetratricopeptide (TPR) repeat protein
VLEELRTHSNGNFLRARLLADVVLDGTLTPDGVRTVERQFASFLFQVAQKRWPDVAEYRSRLRPILAVLAAAREPLDVLFLQGVLGVELGVLDASLDRLQPLLRRGRLGGTPSYTLSHTAARNWLTNVEESGPYVVSSQEGHQLLANWGWRLRQSVEVPAYYRTHLAVHLTEAGEWDRLLSLIHSPQFGLLARWTDSGQSAEGLDCLDGLLKHTRKERPVSPDLAGLLTQAARLHSSRGDYDEADQLLSEAVRSCSPWRFRRAYAIALHERGTLHLYRDRLTDAESCYRRAYWACVLGLPVHRDEAAANLIGLASVAFDTGKLGRAKRYAIRAASAAHHAGDAPHFVAALRLLGLVNRDLAAFEAATDCLNSANDVAESAAVHVELPRVALGQGWLSYDQEALRNGRLEATQARFQEALSMAEYYNSYFSIAEAKLSLAWCSLANNELGSATTWLTELRPILRLGSHRGLWCGSEVASAAAVHVGGNLVGAQRAYRGAIATCEKNGNVTWRIRALIGLGAVYSLLAKPADAQRTWGTALSLAGAAWPSLRRVAEVATARARGMPAASPR